MFTAFASMQEVGITAADAAAWPCSCFPPQPLRTRLVVIQHVQQQQVTALLRQRFCAGDAKQRSGIDGQHTCDCDTCICKLGSGRM